MPTDFHETVRGYLRVDAGNVANADVDGAVLIVEQVLFAVGGVAHSVGSYAAVPAGDLAAFDGAISLMAAAWLRPYMPKQEAAGEVVKWASGTDAYTWAPPVKAEATIEERWLDMAWTLLSSTQALSSSMAAASAVGAGLVASGRRRHREPYYRLGPAGLRVNPLVAMWGEWAASGGWPGWSWLGARP